ncbi:hypothetical protein Aca07nite_76870 [Actinoplanes capillaceus]|uniref:Uncharacterized protein n=1 Tax=Actinoplanes campanulatus TaxID=113559 RepID=A0ABQ3WVU1_9ACTN|nr:hypothetical protein [Actinoplanes capillaceus]GID50412.1 hypothetical protein Aca07nite_76870 [Actinoplanes capillaceus]
MNSIPLLADGAHAHALTAAMTLAFTVLLVAMVLKATYRLLIKALHLSTMVALRATTALLLTVVIIGYLNR